MLGSEDFYDDIRAAVINWLISNPDYLLDKDDPSTTIQSVKNEDEEWEAFIERMSLSEEWGEEITLIAAAEHFQCSILQDATSSYYTRHFDSFYMEKRGECGANDDDSTKECGGYCIDSYH